MSSLEHRFHAAAAYVRGDSDIVRLPSTLRLQLYGLYKVATIGPCRQPAPSLFDQVGRKKHLAWQEKSHLEPNVAKELYCKLTEDQCPNFIADSFAEEEEDDATNDDGPAPPPPSLTSQPSMEDLLSEVDKLKQELEKAKTEKDSPSEGAGYLYQYQNKYSWATLRVGTWVLRYVVVDGPQILVYQNEEQRNKAPPLETYNLHHCVVRYDGAKKHGKFYAFSVWLVDSEHVISHEGRIVLRASATTAEDAALWLQAFQNGITMAEATEHGEDEPTRAPGALGLASLEIADDGDADTAPTEEESERRQRLSDVLAKSPVAAKRKGHPSEPALPPVKKVLDPSSYPPSRPMHKEIQASLMSSEAGKQDYRGFFNLGALLLLVLNFRMVIDNIKKYGLLLAVPSFGDRFEDWPCLTGIALLNANVLLALSIEKFAANRIVPEMLARLLHFLNLAAVLVVPCIVVYSPLVSSPPAASCYIFISTVLWMKLVSYAHVNQDLRKHTQKNNESALEFRRSLAAKVKHTEATIEYPDNLSVANLYYFWAAPTLSYQLNYPRSERIRSGYVFSLICQIVVVSALIIFISEQYIVPHIMAAMPEFDEGSISIPLIVEGTLRLSLSTTYVWLLSFYLVFHLFLNLLAELLRFGDRVFYKDWWNATTVGEYWRLWNLPVHHWMVRHCFFPCLRLGMSQIACYLLRVLCLRRVPRVPCKRTVQAYPGLGIFSYDGANSSCCAFETDGQGLQPRKRVHRQYAVLGKLFVSWGNLLQYSSTTMTSRDNWKILTSVLQMLWFLATVQFYERRQNRSSQGWELLKSYEKLSSFGESQQ